MTATAAPTLSTAADRSVAMRLLPLAGISYVLAWLIGLLIAPSSPANGASDATIHRYFVAHAGTATVQALLVHGIAGLALIALTAGFATALRHSRYARLIIGSGVAAAVVSLAQFAFAVAAAHDARHAGSSTTATWFHAINYADTIKLMLLAVFAAAVTAAGGRMVSRWLRVTGRALVPLLVLGALDFIVDSAVLGVALDLSLVVLLVWTGAAAWQLCRRSA